MVKSIVLILALLISSLSFAQTNSSKTYFDKQGKATTSNLAYYYRIQESNDLYKCYFINENLFFEGKIIKLDKINDNNNLYSGTCKWYYKNGKIKATRTFDAKGLENGISSHYYENGKIWKEINFINGKMKDNSFVEYDENGVAYNIFEEDFSTNTNDWDLYASNKGAANILNGVLELTSFTPEGTSRFINVSTASSDIIIEALIDISALKIGSKAGIIFGFKDWQNYNFFVVTNSTFFIGTVFEGLSSIRAEDMYTSSLLKTGYNNLKILNIDDKSVFSINGEIQMTTDNYRLYGNKIGFILSGENKIMIDRLITKEVNFNALNSGENISFEDKNIKATGSGIIISKNGYIITNHHVIEKAKDVLIELNENGVMKTYIASVIISDKDNDLSILQIKDPKFKGFEKIAYSFKESGALEVGSTVFTLGYPMALAGMGKETKFTDGKISSKTGYNNSINSFQTSVPVQPGNSGGPLFDDKGKLIGVINAKIKEADNVSYAIKLNYIKNLIEILPETIDIPNDTSVSNLSLQEQVKLLSNYVVLIKIK